MNKFGEVLRDLRTAQNLGLREAALKVGISPAYLSRIERGKESPPRPEIIKELAKLLGADPDVLFRLSSSTDPVIADLLKTSRETSNLMRYLLENEFSDEDVILLINEAKKIKKTGADREKASVARPGE